MPSLYPWVLRSPSASSTDQMTKSIIYENKGPAPVLRYGPLSEAAAPAVASGLGSLSDRSLRGLYYSALGSKTRTVAISPSWIAQCSKVPETSPFSSNSWSPAAPR